MNTVWYRRYPSDFLNGVADLSAEERGVYVTLIDMLYDQGGSIIDDPSRLARRCGCSTRRFNQVKTRLLASEKLIVFKGRIFNKRVFKALKPEFISDLSLKYLVLIYPEWRKFKGLADTKTLDSRLHKKINKKRIKRVGTESPAPEPDERELYDVVCAVHGEDIWKAWFSPEQVSIAKGVLIPRTKFIRSKIVSSYDDVVIAAGLTLGDVKSRGV